jgi:hypothetical protein
MIERLREIGGGALGDRARVAVDVVVVAEDEERHALQRGVGLEARLRGVARDAPAVIVEHHEPRRQQVGGGVDLRLRHLRGLETGHAEDCRGRVPVLARWPDHQGITDARRLSLARQRSDRVVAPAGAGAGEGAGAGVRAGAGTAARAAPRPGPSVSR